MKLDNPTYLDRIFHPQPVKKPSSTQTIENVNLHCEDNTLIGCRFHVSSKEAPTIFYFHGNGEVANDYDEIATFYTGKDLNFFVATYRGYGWSEGNPTVSDLIADSGYLFSQFLAYLQDNGITGPVIVMGRSLGSVSAIQIAKNNPDSIKALIIESGFADTIPLLETLGINPEVDDLCEADGFGNKENIEQIKLPTLILHGSRDSLIPPIQSERLQIASGARVKKFYLIPGADHNTTISAGGDMYFTSIKDFIDTVTGVEVWKKRTRYRDKKR